MKKNSLLKAIGVMFLLYVVISWFVPTGYFSEGELVKEAVTPVGLFDIVRYPLIAATSSIFILSALVILVIGGVYGVLNKTGAYKKLVDGVVNKFKEEKPVFLVITILVFTILSSLTGQTLTLFVLVPFFATIILLLGYNKITAMISTIGSILVGNLASTYGFNVAGYTSYLTKNMNDSIIYKIVLFVLLVGFLIFVVLKGSKDDKKVKAEEISLYSKEAKTKKSCTSLVVLSIITMLVIIIGMFNWSEVFNITFFDDLYTKIVEFEFNGYPLFANIIGSIYAIGHWTNYELALTLIIFALLIGWIYNLKFNEIVSSFIDGAKKMVPVALYTIIANLLFLLMNSSSTGATFFNTISNAIFGLTKGFNVLTYSLTAFLGSFLYNDYPYLLSALYSPITTLFENVSLVGFITSSIHGLVQIIAPTSIMLVAGLTYFDIPYTEWLKKIWKYVLYCLIVLALIIIVMALI